MASDAVAHHDPYSPLALGRRLSSICAAKAKGGRESGAFLLGRDGNSPARVTAYLCLTTTSIPPPIRAARLQFHAAGYAALCGNYCKKKQLQVLADVHTHPGRDVGQSPIDQRHPMLPVVGHTAMIVPNFAQDGAGGRMKAVGVYEYIGNFQWRSHPPSARPRRVKLSLW